MSEIKAEEAAERLRQCNCPIGWSSSCLIHGASIDDRLNYGQLLTERESLLKYKEAFEAMVEYSLVVIKPASDNRNRNVRIYEQFDHDLAFVLEGATPLEAVMAAKKGLAGR